MKCKEVEGVYSGLEGNEKGAFWGVSHVPGSSPFLLNLLVNPHNHPECLFSFYRGGVWAQRSTLWAVPVPML